MKSDRRHLLRQRIRAAGLRATQARILVLAHLEDAGAPLTHGAVADALDAAGLDRATVYRNLVDLAEVGVARRSDFGDHVWRFEVNHGEHREESHVHFVCRACGGVECLPRDTVVVKPTRDTPRGLRSEIEINISGVCDACG